LDGQQIEGPRPKSDRSWTASYHREGQFWKPGRLPDSGLRKVHNLQGPIDDAFMGSFVFVEPTSEAARPKVEEWTRSEYDHAVEHWRRHFRGRPRTMRDKQIDESAIAAHNLVLFGDPSSNDVIAGIADRLPIKWTKESIVVGEKSYPAETHALIMIYPNPLNSEKYIVLNSGFTFREYDYLNNARQVPKLPDWAIVDITVPPHSRGPGKIVDAGFFNERWELNSSR
jgi:hypothetical protein